MIYILYKNERTKNSVQSNWPIDSYRQHIRSKAGPHQNLERFVAAQVFTERQINGGVKR